MSLRQLLFEPAEFFAAERDSWLGGLLAVLALCLLALASLLVPLVVLLGSGKDLGVAESFPTVRYVAGEARLVLDGRSLGVLAIVTLAPLPLLVGYTLLFQLLSWPVASRGSIRETATVVAWGTVPLAMANALTLVGTVAEIPRTFGDLGLAYVTLTGRTVVQQSEPSLLLLVVNVLGLGCLVWTALVWMRGVEHVRGLSTRQAAIVVGGPVAIAAGLNVTSLLYGYL